MKAACDTRTFPYWSLRGSLRVWDGAAGSRPQGRAAVGPTLQQRTPAHTSAHQRSRSPRPPVSRWDFCTLVLPLLVLSPAPFPRCSAPLPHRSRIDSAVRGTPTPYVSRCAPQDQQHPKRASLQRRRGLSASRTDGAAGHPDGIHTSQINTSKHALGTMQDMSVKKMAKTGLVLQRSRY